ncbi:MAG: hypothetical protein WDZ45_01675 [Flavobacteriaceae bacterium]
MEQKVSILFPRKVIDFLDELLYTLYEKNYFSYTHSASEYVQKNYDFIESNITTFPHKNTPKAIQYLGVHYIFYKPNQRTTWYVFFEIQGDSFKITAIINNYCKEANFL